MPVGLAIPVTVSSTGGMRLVESDENNSKIIALALGSDENENAFQQDIGLGDFMVFALEDANIQGKILGRLRDIFKRFEAQKRFRLMTNTIEWTTDPATQELTLQFRYLDLESDEVNTYNKTFDSRI